MFRFPSKHKLISKDKMIFIEKYILENSNLTLEDYRDVRKKLVKLGLNNEVLKKHRRKLLNVINDRIDLLRVNK